jgi:hypothetical protein
MNGSRAYSVYLMDELFSYTRFYQCSLADAHVPRHIMWSNVTSCRDNQLLHAARNLSCQSLSTGSGLFCNILLSTRVKVKPVCGLALNKREGREQDNTQFLEEGASELHGCCRRDIVSASYSDRIAAI